ncbi:MAG TPA: lipid IV(A) 3-deoxy-D-manno-octulosonic acid transferase [Pelomicrobium sp.]|nr:lipid IV(A) 3-deoxy-D-manno-octulosonic acid transferase [Pelomicrobium sp.]
MRVLYNALLWIALPFLPLRLAWRARRQPEYLQHVGERFGRYPPAPARPVIWIHAVSVGETRAAAPLVAALRKQHPDHAIVMTHMTPTGRAAGEQLFGDSVMRVYLPWDYPFAVARFLRHFRPRLGLLMETEVWFNLVRGCRAAGVPLYLVNARLSERSARGYRRLGALARDAFGGLAGALAQTEGDAQRLASVGARNIEVTGNLKFDITPSPVQLELGKRLRASFGAERPVWLAASTREGEEEIVLEAFAALGVPGALLVLVPRHPQRFDAVAELLARRGIDYQRRSADAPVPPEVAVVLGDSMGELFAYYAAADVAFVGGSLLPLGGQNLIEACAVGVPVLVGPHTFNFEEATRLAIEAGAAERVEDVAALGQAAGALLADPARRAEMAAAGRDFAARHRGATARTLKEISTGTC